MKSPFSKISRLTGTLALVAGATNLGATQFISNLGNIWDNGIGDIQTIAPGQTYASSFATGPACSFVLNSVTVEFLTWGDPSYLPPSPAQGFHLQLYEPLGFFSLKLIGELGDPTLNPQPTQWPAYTAFFDYTPLTEITLDPSATYALAASQAPNGTDGPLLLFTYHQSDTLDGWELLTTSQGTFDGSTVQVLGSFFRYNLVMAVEATPVPEPAAASLLLVASLAAASLRRSK